MSKSQWAVLVIAVIACGAFCFFFELYEDTDTNDGTAESRANRLLALELFCEEMGTTLTQGGLADDAQASDGVALLILGDAPTHSTLVERLSTWVNDGGRLWIVRELNDGALGLAEKWRRAVDMEEDPGEWEFDPILDAFGLEDRNSAPGTTLTEVEVDGEFFNTDVRPRRVLKQGDAEEFDEYGAFGELEIGYGRVLYVGNGDWLTNEKLGEAKHASLFWKLATKDGHPDTIWVMRGRAKGSLAHWLLGPGLSFLAIFLLALAFMIARRGMRLGPVQEELSTRRRDFAEHLEASGAFRWRRGDRGAFLQSVRDAVAPNSPTGEERGAWLTTVAAKTGLDRTRLRAAWTATESPDARAFVRTVQTLVKQAGEPKQRDPKDA